MGMVLAPFDLETKIWSAVTCHRFGLNIGLSIGLNIHR